MRTQIILASHETMSFFVFPSLVTDGLEHANLDVGLPAMFDWESSATPDAAGHLHVHIVCEEESCPDPGATPTR